MRPECTDAALIVVAESGVEGIPENLRLCGVFVSEDAKVQSPFPARRAAPIRKAKRKHRSQRDADKENEPPSSPSASPIGLKKNFGDAIQFATPKKPVARRRKLVLQEDEEEEKEEESHSTGNTKEATPSTTAPRRSKLASAYSVPLTTRRRKKPNKNSANWILF